MFPDEPKITYAQNGEDVRVWRTLRDLDSPVYVEVGAHDPYEMSVTASLSRLGWHGVLVEADPEMAERLREARPRDSVVEAAAYDRGGLLHLQHTEKLGQAFVRADEPADQPGDNTVTVTVPAVRLDDVLETAGHDQIHFMSIDVEGAEAAVLRGCDLRRWRPWILCIEATEPDSRTPAWREWEVGVLAAGYRFVASDGLNRWYLADEHAELADVLAEPFNVLDEGLDGWRRVTLVALEQDNAALVDRLESTAELLAEERKTAAARVAERDQARVERDQARVERDQARESLALILASPSWRVTAPLRGVKRLAGRDRRGAAVALLGRADAALQSRPVLRQRLLAALDRSPALAGVVRWALAGRQRPSALHLVGAGDDKVQRRRETAVAALEQRARLRRSGS